MDLIIHYCKDGSLPDDNDEAHRIKAQASRYWLSPDQKLYRRFTLVPASDVCTQKRSRAFYLNYMKAVATVIQVADLSPIVHEAKATGGPICKEMPMLIPKTVTSLEAFTNHSSASNITSPLPVCGPLHNGG